MDRDNATVGKLVGDFKGGIEQSNKNLQAVSPPSLPLYPFMHEIRSKERG